MSAVPTPAESTVLLGQERALAVLTRALRQDRLPHAWLLTGPAGIGKATLAFRFARLLLAGEAEAERCHDPDHAVFRMVARGAHPDLHVLRRELDRAGKRLKKEIVVDQLRAVIEALRSTAVLGGRRVLIVDAADDLNIEAANAFLKLLEEPPRGVVLLLVCQRQGRVPATIISRCARLRLRPLAQDAVEGLLARLRPEIDPGARKLAAAAAEGSPGRAIKLSSTGWLEAYGTLVSTLADQEPGLGATLASTDLLAARARGQGVDEALGLLASLVHRVARTAAGRVPDHELVPGEHERLRSMASALGLDRALALWEKVWNFGDRIEAVNLDPWQTFLPLVQAISSPRGQG